jgi:hypothetical protein
MAEIIASEKHPDLIGRLALIEMSYMKIFKAEPDAPPDTGGLSATGVR